MTALLARHRKRALSADEVLVRLRTSPLTLAPGSCDAILFHVSVPLPQLCVVGAELEHCREQLAELLAHAGRQAEIVASHKSVGAIITATLISEAPQALAECDLQALRRLAGTAPVTKSSGKSLNVSMRRGCNTRVRTAVRHWAWSAMRSDPYGRTLYDAMRARGLRHERALRELADRLLACLISTLRHDELYDPEY